MSKKQYNTWQIDQRLHERAEAKLASIILIDEEHSPQRANELLNELRVHQIELKMQNEELRRTQLALEEARDRYIDLYELAPVGYLTINEQGIIAEINFTGAELFGIEPPKLINRYFSEYVVSKDKDRWHHHFQTAIQQKGKQAIELTLCRADNTIFQVHLDSLAIIDTHAVPAVLRTTLIDITQNKLMEQQLRIAATIFESQEGMFITDAKGMILQVNRAFTHITGYSDEEVIGKNPRILQSGCHDADFYRTMWKSIHNTGVWKGEVWNRRKNGDAYSARLIITAVQDQNGLVSHYVATFDDITLSKLVADEIERLAFYDPLTDLPNRRQLLARLHQAQIISARHYRIGAILFIDLDNFKTLNDTHGHYMGDLLLQQVAQRLIACVRKNDTVARLGGDEFVVILESLSGNIEDVAAEVRIVGAKILAMLNQPYQLDDREHFSSSSIGAVLFHGHQNSVDELLKQADIAMYQAKSAGRNTLRFFDSEMQAALIARTTMESELYRALSEQQFSCYFQAQVNHIGAIVGAELLIRWHHPEGNIMLPLDFIPLAEEIGLILSIGHWVLETACIQIKQWQNFPHTQHLHLAVNISAYQFHQPDFVEQVLAIIKKTGIDARKLRFELTESLVLDDIDDTIFKMNALRKFGICFSMDNFGTGYASLCYLTQLPFNQLKIDQSFVRNISLKSTDTVIIQTIIGMTNNLGIEVIAEGVETQEQRTFLQQHGCLLYQGYLFSQPVPLETFEQLLHRQSLPISKSA